MPAEKDKAKQRTGKADAAGGGTPASTPALTDEQRRKYEMLGMLPSTTPPPAPATSGMGILDVLAMSENGPPGSDEMMTLPSGTTIQNDPVPLGNGLVGVESTMTVPGHAPVTSAPSLGISPRETAGFYSTNPFYTPQQRDRDLALTTGSLMGPHTPADRAAAAARLNAHWDQSAAPRHPSGALLMPGPGYSSTELVRDLQWATTTGPLDTLGEQRRADAENRLWRLGAYTRQEQESDQLTAQLGNYTLNHPRYREELRKLLLDGVSRDDADTILADRAAAAQRRLQQADIPVMYPDEVEPLRNNQFLNPVDPDNPLVAVPDGPPPPINSVTEPEFRAWIGGLTGLGDLSEGIETGNYGQAAFGAGMTLLTFTPGAVLRPLGKGFGWLGRKIMGETEQGVATQLGMAGRTGATPGPGPARTPGENGPGPARPHTPSENSPGASRPATTDVAPPDLSGPPQLSPAKVQFRAEGERVLGEMKVGATDETVADAVFGARPPGDPGRGRATEVIGGGTQFGKAGRRAGLPETGIEWALAQGGRNNPARFTNSFEYYKVQYDIYRKTAELPPGVSAEQMFVNENIVDKMLARDLDLVRNSGRGSVDLGPNASDAEITQALRNAERLGFGDEMSAAYHPYKHWKEDPELAALGQAEVSAYHDSAARTVRDGTLVKVHLDESTGYRKFTYHRVVDDGDGRSTITEVIVGVDTSGQASILTYGAPKSVRLGPDTAMPPEWTFDEAPAAGRPPVAPGAVDSEVPPANRAPGQDYNWAPWHLPILPLLHEFSPGNEADGDSIAAPSMQLTSDLGHHLGQIAAFLRPPITRLHDQAALPGRGDFGRDESITFNLTVSPPIRQHRAAAEERRFLTYSAHIR
ncbi:hypothetical protein [Nocardia sp. NPDC057227]|uniref:hypothetical protein n=1 Tax=Nocardia sp. NPDC057227 TaxID=3346056 RepID=UPI0036358AC7